MNKRELIKKRLSDMGLNQREAAARIGIMPQALGNYIKGERNFGVAMAQKWSDAFGFNVTWLLTGEGPVLKEQDNATSITVGDFNITQGKNSPINSRTNEKTTELQIENATLKAEIKHLNELILQKDEMIKAQERTIGILLKSN